MENPINLDNAQRYESGSFSGRGEGTGVGRGAGVREGEEEHENGCGIARKKIWT